MYENEKLNENLLKQITGVVLIALAGILVTVMDQVLEGDDVDDRS